jgi:hypothetical protein|tara:strand:+ start:454 stop:645 length:192 start_codon:yes stop_codon:yes gene_type:complete
MSSKVIFKNVSVSKNPEEALYKVVKTVNVLDTDLPGKLFTTEELKTIFPKLGHKHINWEVISE